MAPGGHRRHQTLSQSLDKEVYQVVRKIIDERSQYGDDPLSGSSRLTFANVYDTIKGSNSSLNRKPKKLLEDSIERVLETIQQDAGADSEEDDPERSFEEPPQQPKPSSNGLNKSIVGAWARSGSGNSPPNNIPGSPRRDRDRDQEKNAPVDSEQQAVSSSTKRRLANGEPSQKRRKHGASAASNSNSSSIDKSPPTHVSLASMGGVDAVIQQFEDLLVLPMTRPEIYTSSKVQPPRGVLIHGPPGCGKTMIANAFAAELGVNFISISAPSIVSGMSGESEKALRDHFDEAKRAAPCLIFIDEIDAITPKRESAQREMEKRIVAQLLTCMDDLALEKTDGKPVIVLAATNRPDSLDVALRRGGRFDKEINMSVPNEPVREQILRALTRETNLADDVDFSLLAKRTPGFVGADLNDLVSTAGAAAIKRYLDTLKANSEAATATMDVEMDIDIPPPPPTTTTTATTTEDNDSSLPAPPAHTTTTPTVSPTIASLRRLIKYTKENPPEPNSNEATISITSDDFMTALPQIQPSALREGFATIPSTTFGSIGALRNHITELKTAIISPILNPKLYTNLGITPSSGVLLWGPPGCGKTLLAKACANSSHANFISVKGPELLNKYVGESERAVRQVFNRARSSVPVIIFFDELDALVPRRDGTMSEASARVVNTLLTELDGVGNSREGIYVIAATNRPDIIDPAMLRPGRLETLLFVGLPNAEERVDILRTLCKKLHNFVFDETIAAIARSCEGFSGADLEALLRRAGYAAILRYESQGGSTDSGTITAADFELARSEVRRSVGIDDMRRYEMLQKQWGKS
ncbi:Ribosome biogenesis ATPase rix7 [Exophiala dermatitidis]|uniref:Adenosinetriphosphatase n=2 Tax=Exophiala dermatitidis TaxID=5970 RepID=H6BTV6_EXODN|nr:adenosinetriphosphatase [Exophiala dermatitidis NIH/UT8656]KAJ4501945.1 Ribosome biogenesis ATPase rix7 [Exophiala dermatitidis]EHY55533.1 adenosinetriphosphatase [Exophiala dermatitidis NIH/UT8656]KAJ4502575.1 Ribosome biogenesis ATPase rix7 [Exophiala dermatitidis]KAJ4510275.1 Ribosome biogenesis ATPase rix7 [Exophiala dermatitidis]KAJ4531506.1 Ribosome biogenesis ATPase rix7 [Exophiala dermatitidis]